MSLAEKVIVRLKPRDMSRTKESPTDETTLFQIRSNDSQLRNSPAVAIMSWSRPHDLSMPLS